MTTYNVAIVGATGAVGAAMRQILASRNFPVNKLKLLASSASIGSQLSFKGESLLVEPLGDKSFTGIDFALFSAGATVSREYGPKAVADGAVVIDNSSAFRMDPRVPLVVPEVNPLDAKAHKGIIANPNCSTIQMVVVLKPLHDKYELKRVVVSTYQAVSGSGKQAVAELLEQTRSLLANETIKPKVYPNQIAFNVLPHIDIFMDGGYTKEEIKMIEETKKIMHLPKLAITATTARVPVVNGHSESINIELEQAVDIEDIFNLLRAAPGIEVVDDPASDIYPMPISASGKDATMVGRVRRDNSVKNGINLWVVSDNLRKGAALNAVQIAELLVAG